ncbi:MAG: DUF4097 domain-containing protein, partial [Candidatus Aminicenantes bacterium]|nr:DUF4097 domain-containing protein [Candidatus Aminicenantes bacterium]
MKKREFFIVIAVIAFGLLYNFFESGEADIFIFDECGIYPKGLIDRNHPVSFSRQEQQYSDVASIEIENPAGQIFVKKSENESVVIKPLIRVYHRDQGKAKQIGKEIEISTVKDGGRLTVGIEDANDFPYKRARVHFVVSAPANVELRLHNGYGDIEIKGTGKKITINERHGDIRVQEAAGPLDIYARHGNVALSNISDKVELNCQHGKTILKELGALKLNCAHAQVSIAGVAGETEVDSASYSKLEIENSGKLRIAARHTGLKLAKIRDGVQIENSHSRIELQDVNGDIEIISRHCPIRLARIACTNLIVQNSYGNVVIENISGDSFDLAIEHGHLDLKIDRLAERLNIKNTHSNILLDLPGGLNPVFGIDTRYGRIINKTAGEYPILKEEQHTRLFYGTSGKPIITIDGNYSDITIAD